MKFILLFLASMLTAKADVLKGVKWQSLAVVVENNEVQSVSEKDFFDLVKEAISKNEIVTVYFKSSLGDSATRIPTKYSLSTRQYVEILVISIMMNHRALFDTNSHTGSKDLQALYVDAIMERYFNISNQTASR